MMAVADALSITIWPDAVSKNRSLSPALRLSFRRIFARFIAVQVKSLSYPEIVPHRFHDAVLYDDGELRDRLRAVLTDLPAARARVDGLAEAVRCWDWAVLAPRYDAVLAALAA